MRAKAVARPEDYRWSSYRGYVRAARAAPWMTYAGVLGQFDCRGTAARRAYARFVRAGIDEPPVSPFAGALGGLLIGSERFVTRMRGLLRERPNDGALPELAALKPRPALEKIVETVAAHFGHDASTWQPGRRVDDASRAVAAYLARRRFRYAAGEVAASLGYRGHGGLHSAVARVDRGSDTLKQTAEKLARKLH